MLNLSIPQLSPPPPNKTGWPWTEESKFIPPLMPNGKPWPKISIVTPSYNQGQYLEETIRSVLLQNYPNLEYIIIDGGSTDNSFEIIKKYDDAIFCCVSEPDRGQSHALNKGFQKSSGDWMTWLNADDYYLPNAIERLVEYILENPQADWIVGNTIVVGENCKFQERFMPRFQPDGPWYSYVAIRNFDTSLPQPSSFFSRKAWVAVGELEESFRYAMDIDYWGRLAFSGYRPVAIVHDLACFRIHASSKTSEGLLPFWSEEIRVVDTWLERSTGLERNILMNCRRSLMYGCCKLIVIKFLSRLFGCRVVDGLVKSIYRLKGGK